MSDIGNISPTSEITPERVYLQRREFIKSSLLFAATSSGVGSTLLWLMRGLRAKDHEKTAKAAAAGAPDDTALTVARHYDYASGEKQTPYESVTHYNNFYEFGTRKEQPADLAKNFRTSPWTVSIEGEVAKPRKIGMDEILKAAPLEERVYRHRCVEGWSVVVPWIGYSLSALLKPAEPTPKAKFVAFETFYDLRQMPEARSAGIELPYVEGLRLDEAMHPDAPGVGMYGETLPPQDGAPVRLVLPWKYGFKSIKSIVKIRLLASQPPTTWNIANAHEYGFYSNVNPTVDHPRWSQATERRLGEFSGVRP